MIKKFPEEPRSNIERKIITPGIYPVVNENHENPTHINSLRRSPLSFLTEKYFKKNLKLKI